MQTSALRSKRHNTRHQSRENQTKFLTLLVCLLPFPVVNSLVLRRVPMDEFDGIRSFFPILVVVVLEGAGWERRPEDEKKLANFKAGRARAFFKGSSADCFVDFDFTGCRTADRNLFCTGPPSSADDKGRELGGWVVPAPDVEA